MRFFLAMICSLVLMTACNDEAGAQNTDSAKAVTIVTADGKSYDFKVDLAITPQQQEYGLMNRTKMAGNAGMLFIFDGEAERSFWMKNTLIPLDMIFIKKNGVINHIHQNAKPNDLTSIGSEGPVFAVLELNAGVSDSLVLKDGDIVHHVMFGNAIAK